jgi:hypothetical protein
MPQAYQVIDTFTRVLVSVCPGEADPLICYA